MLNVEPQKSSPVSTVSIGRMESLHYKSRLDKKLSWGYPSFCVGRGSQQMGSKSSEPRKHRCQIKPEAPPRREPATTATARLPKEVQRPAACAFCQRVIISTTVMPLIRA